MKMTTKLKKIFCYQYIAESNILSKSVSDVSSTSAFNFFIHDLPAAGGRAALYVKMCPFADNCVFGDRCR